MRTRTVSSLDFFSSSWTESTLQFFLLLFQCTEKPTFQYCNGAICKLSVCLKKTMRSSIFKSADNLPSPSLSLLYFYFSVSISIFLPFEMNHITYSIWSWIWLMVYSSVFKDKSVKARYLSKMIHSFDVKPSKLVIWYFVKGWCLL